MTTPYTYLIKHIPSGKVYYGVRYAKNCKPSDLWVTYFTSSQYVKRLINKDGVNSFIVEVRRTFDNATSAREWENKVLLRMDVITNPIFLNKTTNKSISPECASSGSKGKTGELCHRFGKKNLKLSELNKLKIGDKNPMFGKTGELAPCYGRSGNKHPMFGKQNLKAKETISRKGCCSVCGFETTIQNLARWHNNNCKKGNKNGTMGTD
jgi:hypothetical protein